MYQLKPKIIELRVLEELPKSNKIGENMNLLIETD